MSTFWLEGLCLASNLWDTAVGVIGLVEAQHAHWQIGSWSLDLSDMSNELDWLRPKQRLCFRFKWKWPQLRVDRELMLIIKQSDQLRSGSVLFHCDANITNLFITGTHDSVTDEANTWQCTKDNTMNTASLRYVFFGNPYVFFNDPYVFFNDPYVLFNDPFFFRQSIFFFCNPYFFSTIYMFYLQYSYVFFQVLM